MQSDSEIENDVGRRKGRTRDDRKRKKIGHEDWKVVGSLIAWTVVLRVVDGNKGHNTSKED